MTTRDLARSPTWTRRRIDRLRRRFADAGIDALLVTRLPNVRYLTGFTGGPACSWSAPTGCCS